MLLGGGSGVFRWVVAAIVAVVFGGVGWCGGGGLVLAWGDDWRR